MRRFAPPVESPISVSLCLCGFVFRRRWFITAMLSEEDTSICDRDPSKSDFVCRAACETRQRARIVNGPMAVPSKKAGSRRPPSSRRTCPPKRQLARSARRRIVVVVVPPVDELDLVGPLQVFNSVNRLAGGTIYTIEVVTTADRLTVEGEGGVLTFIARHHFGQV